MPFGPYKDFSDCVSDQISNGKSEESAKKICGTMQNEVEGAAFDMDKCVEQQKAKGKDDEEAKRICKFIEQRQGAFDLEKCLEEQKAKGKDDEEAKRICKFIEQRQGAEEYEEKEKEEISKDDFDNVGECVKHCIDVLGKTEEQANAFCTKLFEAKVAEVKTTNRNEAIQRYSQTNEVTDKLFVKAFLLDDSVNLNNWGVDPTSIERNINTFIGKPLVLTENFDHPVVDDMSYGHALQYQDIYRVGTIIDIIKMNKEKISPYGNSYYAIIEITNDAAKKAFSTGELPLYVSPAIAQMTLEEDAAKLNTWLALHLAIVDDPAYTVKKAMITGQCAGDQATCLVRLRQAHIQKHGYGQCGFCVEGKLLSVLTAKKTVELADGIKADVKPTFTATSPTTTWTFKVASDNSATATLTHPAITNNDVLVTESEKIITPESKTNTSLESQSQNNQQVHSMENTNPTQNVADVPNTNAPAEQKTAPVAEVKTPAPEQSKPEGGIDFSKSGEDANAILKAEYIQYKAEATILKEQKATLSKKLAETQAELNSLKESLRKSQIASVVTEDLISDAKIREDTIKFFVEQGLSADQVKAVYENVGVKKASTTNVTTPSYEPRMPLVKTAKRSNEEHDVEAIMNIADLIVHDDGGAV